MGEEKDGSSKFEYRERLPVRQMGHPIILSSPMDEKSKYDEIKLEGIPAKFEGIPVGEALIFEEGKPIRGKISTLKKGKPIKEHPELWYMGEEKDGSSKFEYRKHCRMVKGKDYTVIKD